MKILAVSGSLKSDSTNTHLIRGIMQLAPDAVQFVLYSGLADLPHFSPDLDTEAAPEAVARWREALQDANAVLICTPEYAYGIPGALKNALDWVVSSGEFLDKPVAVLSASHNASGGARAHSALLLTLTALAAVTSEATNLIVPMIRTKLDANARIQDAALKQSLEQLLTALVQLATTDHAITTSGKHDE